MIEKRIFTFIANELTIKNTTSLKRRDQFGVELEAEKALFPLVIGLEAYPNGQYFKVTIEPVETPEEKEEVKEEMKEKIQETEKIGETLAQKFKRKCEEYSGPAYYQSLKDYFGIKHLREFVTGFKSPLIPGDIQYLDEDTLRLVLMLQMLYIDAKKLGLKGSEVLDYVLTNGGTSDQVFIIWRDLFEHFNGDNINK